MQSVCVGWDRVGCLGVRLGEGWIGYYRVGYAWIR